MKTDAEVVKVGQIVGVFVGDGRLAAVALVRKYDDNEAKPRVFHAAWNLIDGSDLELE